MAVKVELDYLYRNKYLDPSYDHIILELKRDNPSRLVSELIIMNDIMTREQIKQAYKSISILSVSVENFQPLLIRDYLTDLAYLSAIEKSLKMIVENNMFPLYFREGADLVFALREGEDVIGNTQILNEVMHFFGKSSCSVSVFLASDYDSYLEKFLIQNSLRFDRDDPYKRDVSRLPEVYIVRSILSGATDIYFDAVKDGYQYKYKILNEQIWGNKIVLNEEERKLFLRALYQLEKEIPERVDGEICEDHFIPCLGGMPRYSGRCQHIMQLHGIGPNIRVMDVEKTSRPLDKCGLSPDVLKALKTSMHHRSGEFVFSGPTGSGKSTLMASYIDELSILKPTLRPEESGAPIEQANEKRSQIDLTKGLTYGHFSAASTRRNADIIITSEANTDESAIGYIQCASMDKIAITSTHTPSAAFVVNRFRQLTASQPLYFNDFITNLKMCSHQLMLKECCPKCRVFKKLNDPYFENSHVKMLKHYGFTEDSEIPIAVPKPKCPECEGRGYLIRKPIIIMEVLNITDKIRRKLIAAKDSFEMLDILEQELMSKKATELHDAFYWMNKGLLTFDHIWEKCELESKIDDFIEDTEITIKSETALQLEQ